MSKESFKVPSFVVAVTGVDWSALTEEETRIGPLAGDIVRSWTSVVFATSEADLDVFFLEDLC